MPITEASSQQNGLQMPLVSGSLNAEVSLMILIRAIPTRILGVHRLRGSKGIVILMPILIICRLYVVSPPPQQTTSLFPYYVVFVCLCCWVVMNTWFGFEANVLVWYRSSILPSAATGLVMSGVRAVVRPSLARVVIMWRIIRRLLPRLIGLLIR